MTTYTRDFDDNFNSLLNEVQLMAELNATSLISQTVTSVSRVNDTDVEITFSGSLTTTEEGIMDSIIRNHVPQTIKRRRNQNLMHVKIQHETTKTGEAYKMVGREFNIALLEGSKTDLITIEYPQTILTGFLESGSDNVGDYFSIDINPDTTIGAIGANISVDDRTFTVSSTALQLIKKGRWIRFTDGTNTSNYMEVTSVNEGSSTVTVSSIGDGCDTSFSAATPTFVQMTVKMVEKYPIKAAGIRVIGGATSGGTYMPVGTVIRITYINSNLAAKTVNYAFETLY